MKISDTKPMKRLEKLLTSGNLWLYILSLIKKKGSLYAYALDREIEREYSFRPGRVMIYLVLYKLEAEGIIDSAYKERRKYYRLTKKGNAVLKGGRSYLSKLSKKL